MRNYSTKTIISALTIVFLGVIVSLLMLYTQSRSQLNTTPHEEIPVMSPTTTDERPETTTYYNKKYGYTLNYPSSHPFIIEVSPEKVYVTDERDQPVRVFIGVEPTNYSSSDEWFQAKNAEHRRLKESHGDTYMDDVLEKRIIVGGYDAIVTYPRNETESFPDEKLTLFIRDGHIFQIGTAYMDHERIWNSFRFEK